MLIGAYVRDTTPDEVVVEDPAMAAPEELELFADEIEPVTLELPAAAGPQLMACVTSGPRATSVQQVLVDSN